MCPALTFIEDQLPFKKAGELGSGLRPNAMLPDTLPGLLLLFASARRRAWDFLDAETAICGKELLVSSKQSPPRDS